MAMSKLLQLYQYNIINKPIRTFALQSSCMMTLGDILSQQVIEKRGRENHDVQRSLRMTVYGALVGGPVIGTWFGFIHRLIQIRHTWAATLVRVGVDQVFFSPTILAIFMTGISILEGRSMADIKQKLEKSYVKGLMTSYQFWPFVNLFTFALIPMHYRPLVNSTAGICWNSYLSHLNQTSLQTSAEPVTHTTTATTTTIQ
ncbi:hypothetical protein BDF20DRAFT_899200 [Mycotypha africana]|uniref:uncharacterized protein n=1 Tax=Mycotypha africana TaxID=64632 RepID=UPI0023017859|nr:uncharacterized protein BDF20DRAFT_899200 [Mycotypha africana]KAI8967780.1 hypothetical protein BDF20DRAFT_899200 [Mycotypha africana]